jgi:hypothetical protein
MLFPLKKWRSTYKMDNEELGKIIVTIATNLRKGYTGWIDTEAGLGEYHPRDLEHNLDYLASRTKQSPLLNDVLEGSQTYTQEIYRLFLFQRKCDIAVPADYDSRLKILVEDLNGFRLGREEDLKDKRNMWCKYASNPIPPEKVDRLSSMNAQRVALRGPSPFYEIFPSKFRTAYWHLSTRAKKADNFLYNLTQLYEDLGASLRPKD